MALDDQLSDLISRTANAAIVWAEVSPPHTTHGVDLNLSRSYKASDGNIIYIVSKFKQSPSYMPSSPRSDPSTYPLPDIYELNTDGTSIEDYKVKSLFDCIANRFP
jgi:hypothetical protein